MQNSLAICTEQGKFNKTCSWTKLHFVVTSSSSALKCARHLRCGDSSLMRRRKKEHILFHERDPSEGKGGTKITERRRFTDVLILFCSIAAVEDIRKQGRICILDVDVQGVKSIKKTNLNPKYIFISPPSFQALVSVSFRLQIFKKENAALSRGDKHKNEQPGSWQFKSLVALTKGYRNSSFRKTGCEVAAQKQRNPCKNVSPPPKVKWNTVNDFCLIETCPQVSTRIPTTFLSGISDCSFFAHFTIICLLFFLQVKRMAILISQ